ncbi:uncharacterized protein C5orf34 homolog [Brachyhypopomus gauderio]|uniref:uncharacterized protein C5orf34 homolog n=1 Tax=Brachyhypopomus gauderio TaxID=698409 RepID=UPI0040410AE8
MATAAVGFMVMYDDESVDVTYADGSRLQLSACGAEYVLERARAHTAHPLRSTERVRHRSRFTVSQHKALLVEALNFRNKYATRPYLPEELIQTEKFSPAVCEVEWPPEECSSACVSDGAVVVSSDSGRARLVLAGCGEEFTVEFTCKSSQSERHSALCPEVQRGGRPDITSPAHGDRTQQDITSSAHGDRGQDITAPGEELQEGWSGLNTQEESAVLGRAHTHTRVLQHHSRLQYPPDWQYPLSLALKHWESQRTKCSGAIGQQGGAESEEFPTVESSPRRVVKGCLPPPLPLSCPSPHLHRWRYGNLTSDWSEMDTPTELVRVVWCHGIIYRVTGGAVPVVEVSPGDGSVIRSNGVLAEYFTHYRRSPVAWTVVESVYYLSGLPPDRPGQPYSISSVVTRASRILQAHRQANSSRIPDSAQTCWRRVEVCERVNVMEEVCVTGTGRFQAFSNGTAHITFLDGVEVHMLWNTQTPAQEIGVVQHQSAGAESVLAGAGLCQVSLPDGQQHLLQVHAGGTYHRYMEVAWEWCNWVKESNRASPAHSMSDQPINNRSVLGELQKIRRFNYLLENSTILNFQGHQTQNGRMTSDLNNLPITDRSVCEALQKTSKVIQDINNLLSYLP